MSTIRLGLTAAALALVLGGCDRLQRQWPLRTDPSSVTVKLPPAKTASPGFALQDGRKAGPATVANGT